MTLPLPNPIGEIKAIIIAVVGIILIGLIVWLGWSKANLETNLAKAQTDITALTAANLDWKQQAEEQNKAIEEMQNAEKTRTAAATVAISAAQQQAQSYAKLGTIMLKAKPEGDDCVATKKLTDKYFGAAP